MPKSARGKKYAAKLLYQYEAVNPRLRGQRRLCEESTILIHARSAKEALRRAKRHARRRYFTFRTVNGLKVGFQFVGVRDLMRLGIECEPDEVWYDIVHLVRPMERRAKLIPREADLNAIWLEASPANKRLERARPKQSGRAKGGAAAGRSSRKALDEHRALSKPVALPTDRRYEPRSRPPIPLRKWAVSRRGVEDPSLLAGRRRSLLRLDPAVEGLRRRGVGSASGSRRVFRRNCRGLQLHGVADAGPADTGRLARGLPNDRELACHSPTRVCCT